jgi:hypothetical protein
VPRRLVYARRRFLRGGAVFLYFSLAIFPEECYNNLLFVEDKSMTMEIIRKLCIGDTLRWTNHIVIRLLQRKIAINDVRHALLYGEIIEQYPSDYPYPSCLVLGIALSNKYIHIVCGVAETELWLITAYYPNPAEWSADFRIRKEKIT